MGLRECLTRDPCVLDVVVVIDVQLPSVMRKFNSLNPVPDAST